MAVSVSPLFDWGLCVPILNKTVQPTAIHRIQPQFIPWWICFERIVSCRHGRPPPARSAIQTAGDVNQCSTWCMLMEKLRETMRNHCHWCMFYVRKIGTPQDVHKMSTHVFAKSANQSLPSGSEKVLLEISKNLHNLSYESRPKLLGRLS